MHRRKNQRPAITRAKPRRLEKRVVDQEGFSVRHPVGKKSFRRRGEEVGLEPAPIASWA